MPDDLCLSLGTGAISDGSGNAIDVTFGDFDCNMNLHVMMTLIQ